MSEPTYTIAAHSLDRHGSETYDTDHRDAPICPHCGHAQGDAWEIDFGPGIEGETTISCENCKADFVATRCCTVTYCTAKLPNKQAEPPARKDT